MTEPGQSEARRRTKKLPGASTDKELYRPRGRPAVKTRSPYPFRASEVKYEEASNIDSEVAEDSEVELLQESMAKRGDEGEVAALLRYLVEKDEKDREERKEAEERNRRAKEDEAARRREEEDRARRYREEGEDRRRGEEAARRREEEERRRASKLEEDKIRERRELLQEKLKGLGVYKEGTELGAYLGKFERIMREGKVSENDWGERLYPRLSETLCLRIAQARDSDEPYEEIKKILLKAMGETAITYGNQLLEANGDLFKGMTAGGIADWLLRVTKGMCQGSKSIEECMLAIALAVLRRSLPQSGKAFLEMRKIGEWGELREALEDWMSGRQRGNFYKPLGSGPSEVTRGYRGTVDRESWYGRGGKAQGGGLGDKVGGTYGVVTCYSCGEKGHKASECRKDKQGSSYITRVPTCYNCGKVGHKSPECTAKKVTVAVKKEPNPTKMSMLRRTESGQAENVAYGLVNGVRTKILVDSGAELGSVPKELVPEGVELCSDVYVKGYGGTEKRYKSCMCEFVVGGHVKRIRSIIDESEPSGVTCLVPVSLADDREAMAYREAIREYKLGDRVGVNVLTRSMVRRERELDENEEVTDEVVSWDVVSPEGEGEPEPEEEASSQSDPLNMPEDWSRVGEDQGVEEAEGTPDAEQPRAKAREETDEGSATPLGELSGGTESESELSRIAGEIGPVREGQEKEEFTRELQEDSSLKEWRELGDRKERGFKWKGKVLVRGMYVTWDEYRDVIVLPESYRKKVKVLGHERNGHLGADKVAKMVGRYFAWPGMARDIIRHCRSCERCQVRSKHRPRRAPVVERPILAEPFESVAIDLVGPLPKGKGGCRYILTYVCLATRWPEAVALRSITAKAVMDGLWSIFSRTSVPERILTDQGSQFCGKVMTQLCEHLGIEKVRTSPYHPETNGAVERMHGTMKSVLGKCIDEGVDWVGQLCFVLFVLRQMPHADSGFSPFDMVYGFRVRTPLDALYHGLYEVEAEKLNVCEWVTKMAERLENVRDSAALGMAKGKESRLQYVNKGTKLREFKEGDLVLYRVPGMTCKLSDSWQGPYKILRKMGAVNYRIGKIGNEKHSKVVHVNCIKEFRERACIRRLDIVVEEQEEESSELKGECEGFSESELRELLGTYNDVFSDSPGSTDRVKMTIDTGDSEPIRQTPYSVPLGIREKVKRELESLEEQGVIERCKSNWASPLVPVRKPDGNIRLCVDYRRLNDITTKEPYYIPSFEEMVEKVGVGRVMSKIDLAKGFHQVLMDEDDRDKTCFVCPFGKYRFRRMPFGLTNAPSVFQRLMDEVLVDCREWANVYIDDILVVSEDWGLHLVHLERVLEALRKNGLTCKRSKCSFGRRTLEFLGHQLGGGSISVPEARVEAIRNHPLPRTRKQLRGFLGLVGFYRRFIPGLHQWSSVLTPHTSTAMPGVVSWTSSMLDAFHALCNQLSVSVRLCVPCVSDVFVLECDASSTGVGAVLSVVRNEERLPVAFFSKQLRGAQMNYSAQELEGLGVYEAIRHFAYYLYGRKFTVITDHKGLVNMRCGKQENRRIYNWCLKLCMYDFDIVYRAGDKNVVADDLSRCHGETVVCDRVTQLMKEGGDVGIQEIPTLESKE